MGCLMVARRSDNWRRGNGPGLGVAARVAARRGDRSSRIAGVEPKPASRGRPGRAFLHVLWDAFRISF